MRNMLLFFICLSFLHAPFIWAEKMAITDMGEEVILYDDGSWIYVADQDSKNEIVRNPNTFERSTDATFLLKSKKLNVGFWFDPKEWSFTPKTRNSDAEYELQLKDEDLYAMIITEKIEVPLKSFANIALANAQSIAPDAKIIQKEYRNVNGAKVLLLQIAFTTQGMNFFYYGYSFSNNEGSVQFVTYTSQKLFKSYKKQAEELLNGFVELSKNKK